MDHNLVSGVAVEHRTKSCTERAARLDYHLFMSDWEGNFDLAFVVAGLDQTMDTSCDVFLIPVCDFASDDETVRECQ
jgi:hypothetical protein